MENLDSLVEDNNATRESMVKRARPLPDLSNSGVRISKNEISRSVKKRHVVVLALNRK